jgi:MAF protein
MPQRSVSNIKLILASGSPRRSELVALTGWQAKIRPVVVDESERPGEDGLSLACRLAEAKAIAAAEISDDDALILAADTVVVADSSILGKPASGEDALHMLKILSGKVHKVHTAIALYDAGSRKLLLDVCSTEVPMRNFSVDEASTYVQSGSPLDKAGAYGIQDRVFQPVEDASMTGCYANVVGLPLCHLVRTMRAFGYEPVYEVPSRCQTHTGYDCDVYIQILGDET